MTESAHGASGRTATRTVRLLAVSSDGSARRRDQLAGEEPMEIRVGTPGADQQAVAVTMRTPGSDFELAVGFLITEGVIDSAAAVRSVRYCDVPRAEQQYNVVTVDLDRPVDLSAASRTFYTTSSCGVCGKASLDAIEVRCAPVADGPRVAAEVIRALPGRLRDAQRLFDRTGGLHAAGLFTADGELVVLREDVGRHNALDKVVGERALADALPLAGHVLMVSGRVSFEIVQKAAVAGIPIVCAVSAPSSLAVDAGRRFGMTIVGFVRDDRFNVYSGTERIAAAATDAAAV
jgi:FdhD protein